MAVTPLASIPVTITLVPAPCPASARPGRHGLPMGHRRGPEPVETRNSNLLRIASGPAERKGAEARLPAGSPSASSLASFMGPLKMRIGVIELLAHSSEADRSRSRGLVGKLLRQTYSIMPQVVAVWCRQLGHDVFY